MVAPDFFQVGAKHISRGSREPVNMGARVAFLRDCLANGGHGRLDQLHGKNAFLHRNFR
jgi:hypothetical protein